MASRVDIIIYALFFLLVGCGTNIVVSPVGCETKALWTDGRKIPDFTIERSFWAPFGIAEERVVKVKDLLKSEGISCQDIARVKIDTTYSWQDVFRSMIPFAATRTVVLSGNYITRPDLLSMDGEKEKVCSSHDE
jgi:hypothetical protein